MTNRLNVELIRKRSEIDLGTGCWNWKGSLQSLGYGQVTINYKDISAHRASWMAHNGPIPNCLNVLHHCDNRRCCNPDHLYLGTQSDNMKDMIRRGRRTTKPSGRPITLTPDQIQRIATSGENARFLAQDLGVHLATVYRYRIRATISG